MEDITCVQEFSFNPSNIGVIAFGNIDTTLSVLEFKNRSIYSINLHNKEEKIISQKRIMKMHDEIANIAPAGELGCWIVYKNKGVEYRTGFMGIKIDRDFISTPIVMCANESHLLVQENNDYYVISKDSDTLNIKEIKYSSIIKKAQLVTSKVLDKILFVLFHEDEKKVISIFNYSNAEERCRGHEIVTLVKDDYMLEYEVPMGFSLETFGIVDIKEEDSLFEYFNAILCDIKTHNYEIIRFQICGKLSGMNNILGSDSSYKVSSVLDNTGDKIDNIYIASNADIISERIPIKLGTNERDNNSIIVDSLWADNLEEVPSQKILLVVKDVEAGVNKLMKLTLNENKLEDSKQCNYTIDLCPSIINPLLMHNCVIFYEEDGACKVIPNKFILTDKSKMDYDVAIENAMGGSTESEYIYFQFSSNNMSSRNSSTLDSSRPFTKDMLADDGDNEYGQFVMSVNLNTKNAPLHVNKDQNSSKDEDEKRKKKEKLNKGSRNLRSFVTDLFNASDASIDNNLLNGTNGAGNAHKHLDPHYSSYFHYPKIDSTPKSIPPSTIGSSSVPSVSKLDIK